MEDVFENKQVMSALWSVFAFHILVLIFVGADLIAGVRKARLKGEARTSYGYRKTVDKLSKYYNVLLVFTVLDCIQMIGCWHMHVFNDSTLPIFPFMTMFGAIAIGIIEAISIWETKDAKEKAKYKQAALLAAEMAKAKLDPTKVADVIIDKLKEDEKK